MNMIMMAMFMMTMKKMTTAMMMMMMMMITPMMTPMMMLTLLLLMMIPFIDEFDIKTNEMAAKLLFTFSGGEHASIYWDPTSGYGDVDSDDSTWVDIGIGIAVVCGVGLLVGAAVTFKKYYKKGGNAGFGGTATHNNYGSVP